MDLKSAHLVEKYQDSKLRQGKQDEHDSDSDDDLLDKLEQEDEAFFTKYREQRMQSLSEEFKKIDQIDKDQLGELINIDSERELMDLVTSSERVLIHFQQSNFMRCQIMNKKLAVLAEKHLTTKFVVIDAFKASFLTTKLNIHVLPFLVGYINGKESVRNVGFEKLGNQPDDFDIAILEQLLLSAGIIIRQSTNFRSIKGKKILNHKISQKEEDDDDDLDL